jgi:putative transposase
MEFHLQSGSHTVDALQYHIVAVTKCRFDILTEERLERVAEVAHEIANGSESDIMNADGSTDHVHLLFTTKPTTHITKFINSVKGVTSRRIWQEYADELKTELWGDSFWNNSYCLIPTGQVSLDVLKQYVEDQRE